MEVVGYFLFYARMIDHRMLPSLTFISKKQSAPTEATLAATKHFLRYAACHQDFQATVYASDMLLDVISDGGILITPAGGRAAVFARTWDMRFPVDCPTCETRWEDYAGWLTTRLGPAGRHGLVTFANDAVIGAFFAFPAVDVRAPIAALLSTGYTASPRAAAFVLPGTGHVALDRYRSIAASDGTRIEGWVRAWAGDDASWSTVNP
jgi:hypothetical protein